ncbi:MAG: hypothetical protein HQL60_07830, partial [Magnetococcales bacterium]|nr:hypothetical protein [Magnetococcales bacterium]
IGSFRNMVGLYRAARGRYATYLADDDRLIPERVLEIINYLENNKNVVAYFTSMKLIDRVSHDAMLFWGNFDGVRLFNKSNSIELFNFMVDLPFLPEVYILRTDIYSHFGYHTHKVYFPLNQIFRMLEYGEIVLDSKPYYIQNNNIEAHRVEEQRGKMREGERLLVKEADHVRDSLDIQLFWALKVGGYSELSEQVRAGLLEKANQAAMNSVLMNASIVLSRGRDYVTASELIKRVMLWQGYHENPGFQALVEQWERYAFLAAFQAIIEQTTTMPSGGKLILMPDMSASGNTGGVVAALRQHWPGTTIEVLSEADVIADQDMDRCIITTFSPEVRNRLIDGGMAAGRVILFHEWLKNFKISWNDSPNGGSPLPSVFDTEKFHQLVGRPHVTSTV